MRTTLLILMLTACGGSAARPSTPAAPTGDPCAAGVRAGGPTPVAAEDWLAVARAVGYEGDICVNAPDPCDPDLAVSALGTETGSLAIKVGGGYRVLDGLWQTYGGPGPEVRIESVGALTRVAVRLDELGREEACLDGEDEDTADCGTATVVTAITYFDYLIDPTTGAVVWRATCGIEGDAFSQATGVTADGATFAYTGCARGAAPVRFTLADLAACPEE